MSGCGDATTDSNLLTVVRKVRSHCLGELCGRHGASRDLTAAATTVVHHGVYSVAGVGTN